MTTYVRYVTLSSPADLDALPVKSVVIDADWDAWQKVQWGNHIGWALANDSGPIFGPEEASVLLSYGAVTLVWTPA